MLCVNDDWNIDNRWWSKKMSSLGGPTNRIYRKTFWMASFINSSVVVRDRYFQFVVLNFCCQNHLPICKCLSALFSVLRICFLIPHKQHDIVWCLNPLQLEYFLFALFLLQIFHVYVCMYLLRTRKWYTFANKLY